MRPFYSVLLLYFSFLSIASTQPFQNQLPIPPITSGNLIELEAQNARHNFDPNGTITSVDIDTLLSTYCYNIKGQNQMTYLGSYYSVDPKRNIQPFNSE